MDNVTSHPSEVYDQEISKIIPYYTAIHEEIIRLVQSVPPEPVSWLDTGCGTGNFVYQAMTVFPKVRFYLVDPSEKMLEQAAKKVKGDNVTFLAPIETQNLPVHSSHSYDIITAIQCHHYLHRDERLKAVSTCYSLLADDGMFITSENIRPHSQEGTEICIRYWHDFQKRQGRSEADIQKHLLRFDTEYFPLTITGHLDLYRSAGFRVVEILWVSYMQAVLYCIK